MALGGGRQAIPPYEGGEGCVYCREVFVDCVRAFVRVVGQFTDVIQAVLLFGTKYSLHMVEPVTRFSLAYSLHLSCMIVSFCLLDFICNFS